MDNTSFAFNEQNGKITPKDDFKGTNILIKLNLDKSKANPKKAQEYLDKLNEKPESADDLPEADGSDRSDSENTEIKLYENDSFKVDVDENDKSFSLVIADK